MGWHLAVRLRRWCNHVSGRSSTPVPSNSAALSSSTRPAATSSTSRKAEPGQDGSATAITCESIRSYLAQQHVHVAGDR
eukprot:4496639-Prymnesium_polylepis.1